MQSFIALAVLLTQDPGIDSLIQQLADESIEARTKAENQIVARWKVWTAADLEKLRKAAEGKEAETAGRTKAILEAIRLHKMFPAPLLKALPNLFTLLRDGTPAEIADAIKRVEKLVTLHELSGHDAAPFLIELLSDERLAESEPFELSKTPKVRDLAHTLLGRVVFKPGLVTRDEWRVWWDAHREKPEREWHLSELESENVEARLEAILRLARLNDPDAYPIVLKAVSTLSPAEVLARGIASLAPLPKDILLQGVSAYLQHDALGVRLAVARILYPHVPDQAIRSMIDAMESPKAKKNHWLGEGGYGPEQDPTYWLAEIKDEKAHAYLFQVLKTGEEWQSDRVIMAIRDKDHPGVDEALIEAFGNQNISHISFKGNDVEYRSPRIGDLASMAMADRLHLKDRFNWVCSTRKRDRTLLEIKNRWRETKGLERLPMPSLESARVPLDKVLDLVPMLTSHKEEDREGARTRLVALGAGAYPHLQGEITHSEGARRKSLEEAAQTFSNVLRGVETRGDLAKELAENLRKHLDQPLQIDVIRNEVIDPWIESTALTALYIEFEKDTDGRGFTAILSASMDRPAGNSYSYHTEGVGGGGKPLRKEGMREAIKKHFLDPLREATQKPPGEYRYGWMTIEKYSPQ
jgi:hypothetical protein